MKRLTAVTLFALASFALAANNALVVRGWGTVTNPRGKTMDVKFDFCRKWDGAKWVYSGKGFAKANVLRNYLPTVTELTFGAPKSALKNGTVGVVEVPVHVSITNSAEHIVSDGMARLTINDTRKNGEGPADTFRLQLNVPNVPPADWTGESTVGDLQVFETVR